MNRYAGIIFLVIVMALVYAIGLYLLKSGVFGEIFQPISGISFKSSDWFRISSSSNSAPDSAKKDDSPQQKNIEPPSGFAVSELSPHFGEIVINSVSRGYFSNQKAVSGFSARTAHSLKNSVNITGWRIKGNKGAEIEIPKAINLFNAAGSWTEGNIVLGSAENINFYNSASPFGRNLRLNKCTGYLNNFYEFKPALPNNCPSVNRKEIVGFSGDCQNLITSLGICKLPKEKDLNAPFVLNEPVCRSFLDRLNFRGCFERYSSGNDFLSNEWRVWLGKNIPFDSEHDRLLLFDESGLLVDEYVY